MQRRVVKSRAGEELRRDRVIADVGVIGGDVQRAGGDHNRSREVDLLPAARRLVAERGPRQQRAARAVRIRQPQAPHVRSRVGRPLVEPHAIDKTADIARKRDPELDRAGIVPARDLRRRRGRKQQTWTVRRSARRRSQSERQHHHRNKPRDAFRHCFPETLRTRARSDGFFRWTNGLDRTLLAFKHLPELAGEALLLTREGYYSQEGSIVHYSDIWSMPHGDSLATNRRPSGSQTPRAGRLLTTPENVSDKLATTLARLKAAAGGGMARLHAQGKLSAPSWPSARVRVTRGKVVSSKHR
jgi:hypothetical protein